MYSLAPLTPPPPPLAGSPNPRPLFYRESRFRRDALNHSAIPPLPLSSKLLTPAFAPKPFFRLRRRSRMCSFAPPPPPVAGSPNPRPLFYRESRFRRDALNHSAIPPLPLLSKLLTPAFAPKPSFRLRRRSRMCSFAPPPPPLAGSPNPVPCFIGNPVSDGTP